MFLCFSESRFWRAKRGMVLIAVGILLILSLIFFQKETKGFFYSLSSPLQKSLWGAGDRVSDFFETITEIKSLKKENEWLELMNQKLLAEVVSLRELKEENKTLREALGVGLQKDFKLALAEVIGKDINQDSILINKGSRDGISKGFPVITQEKVLLGRVIEAYGAFSKVMLISDKESSFDAKISDSRISGVIKGAGGFKIALDLVSQDKEVKEGDLLVTTSLGGIYPRGLLVGLVERAEKSDIEPFQQIKVLPFFDISNLENVLIILDL